VNKAHGEEAAHETAGKVKKVEGHTRRRQKAGYRKGKQASEGYVSAEGEVTGEGQLRFYAMYQQCIKGDCTSPEPPEYEYDAHEKWEAHRSIRGCPSRAF